MARAQPGVPGAALDHIQDHPEAAGPLALRRTGPHAYVLGTRTDMLAEEQRLHAVFTPADRAPGKVRLHSIYARSITVPRRCATGRCRAPSTT
ncbi:hypothetical protein [Nocardiopsis synnemataformans]|uniref:hypothetical protein n=1 Tax=Nocardiopsis synnemataformans TaxID=61305 RepID=UPI003EBBF43B